MVKLHVRQTEGYDLYGNVLESVVLDDNGTKKAFVCTRDELPQVLWKYIRAINDQREYDVAEERGDQQIMMPFHGDESVGQLLSTWG